MYSPLRRTYHGLREGGAYNGVGEKGWVAKSPYFGANIIAIAA